MADLVIDKPTLGERGSLVSLLLEQPDLQPYVGAINEVELADLEMSLEWYCVPAGATLFNQGDPASDIFFVTAGRLGVFVETGKNAQLVAQIQPGELVGEMALISNERRSATVTALRETNVLRLPIGIADRLMSSNPKFMLILLRLLSSRLKSTSQGYPTKQAAKVIAVVPINNGPIDQDFGEGLHTEFAKLVRSAGFVDSRNMNLTTAELDAFEKQHEFVTYCGDVRSSSWSKRCLAQADRVIFVANGADVPDDEADDCIGAVRRLRRPADIVLLARSDASRPNGASAWLRHFSPHEIFHVRRGRGADYARVARLSVGLANGVVFSGGGARGFAHIGAIRALYAAKIPIDLLGGTSIGAIVAGVAAMGGDADEITKMFHHAFVRNNPLSDYTFPLISLIRGRKMSRLLRHHFGETTIEDLWKFFFCLSTDLTTGGVRIHETGLAWRAVRASAAIPGILPPSIEAGHVLVDGGIMNNFPTDVMRSLRRGRVIGVDVGTEVPFSSNIDNIEIEDKSLLWLLFKRRGRVPGILDILMRAGTIDREEQRAASQGAVDILIKPKLGSMGFMSFTRFDEGIECGYRATMEAIEQLDRAPETTAGEAIAAS